MSSRIIENILKNNNVDPDFKNVNSAMRRLLGYTDYNEDIDDNNPIDPKPSGWMQSSDSQKNFLIKTYDLSSKKFVMYFLSELHDLATQYNHHPEIHIKENEVTVVLYTEMMNDVSDVDISLSKQIDDIIEDIDIIRF